MTKSHVLLLKKEKWKNREAFLEDDLKNVSAAQGSRGEVRGAGQEARSSKTRREKWPSTSRVALKAKGKRKL